MSSWIGPVASWLAEVYVLSTVILAAATLTMLRLRQPAHRLAVARSALVSLALLAPLVAGAKGARALWTNANANPRAAGAQGLDRDELRALWSELGENAPAVASQQVQISWCACPTESAAAVPPIDRPGASDGGAVRPMTVLAVFGAGSCATFAWLGLGAIASAQLIATTLAAPQRLEALLGRIVGEGVKPPRLVIGTSVVHPAAVGLIRPTIILPSWFAEAEPEERIAAALAHEWAHIRNGDLRLLALSRLLLPLLFAHPLYAMLRRRMRADQEALADAAAAGSEGPIAYSEALLHWSRASTRAVRHSFAPSLALWERPSMLATRVALLLDRDFRVEPLCPRRGRLGVGVLSAAMVAGLGLVSLSGAAESGLAPARSTQDFAHRPHVHAVSTSTPSGGAERWADVCCKR